MRPQDEYRWWGGGERERPNIKYLVFSFELISLNIAEAIYIIQTVISPYPVRIYNLSFGISLYRSIVERFNHFSAKFNEYYWAGEKLIEPDAVIKH